MNSLRCGSELTISESVQAYWEDHLTVMLQRRLKHRAEKVWSLKDLSFVKLKQDWLSDSNGIDWLS